MEEEKFKLPSREEIEKHLTDRIPKQREIKVWRGCIERGAISPDNTFTFCKNDKCSSCKMVKEALDNAFKDFVVFDKSTIHVIQNDKDNG